jgi:hypothetical protein
LNKAWGLIYVALNSYLRRAVRLSSTCGLSRLARALIAAGSHMSNTISCYDTLKDGVLSCAVSRLANLPTHQTFRVLAKVTPPAAALHVSNARAPARICAVIDSSASMAGCKMELSKAATQLMVQQLTEQDMFALVSYDTKVA